MAFLEDTDDEADGDLVLDQRPDQGVDLTGEVVLSGAGVWVLCRSGCTGNCEEQGKEDGSP
ncbi:MAG: hypothetical protein ACYTKC_18655 [Planctomycetota bacterium]|jgi:hypothetical protein